MKYNYSSALQAPERHYYRLFTAPEMTPVLTYREQMVVGEKQEGIGCWVICSLKLQGKLDTAPPVSRMVRKVVEGK